MLRIGWVVGGLVVVLGGAWWALARSRAPAAAAPAAPSVAIAKAPEEVTLDTGTLAPSRALAGDVDATHAQESEVAHDAEATAPARDLATELDDLAPTFLSDDPDLARLDRALTRLAELATVVEGSLRVDPVSGRVDGELDLGEGLPRGEFTLEGDHARVQLASPAQGAEANGLLLRTVGLSFTSDSAGLSSSQASLQFHPDPRLASGSQLAPGVEAYAGWRVARDLDGVRASPIAMRAADDGRAWEIGAPRTLEAHARPMDVGVAACATLGAKLRAVRR